MEVFILQNNEDKEKLARWRRYQRENLSNKKLKIQISDDLKELLIDKLEVDFKKKLLRKKSKRKICKDADLDNFL